MTIVGLTTEVLLRRWITVAVGLATAGACLVCSTWLFDSNILVSRCGAAVYLRTYLCVQLSQRFVELSAINGTGRTKYSHLGIVTDCSMRHLLWEHT